MANLTSSTYPIYSTGTYRCGLTLNLNLVSHFQSNVILGGLYKGKTLKRLRRHLPFSIINIFEPSKYQQKYGEFIQENDPLISVIPCALGNVPESGYSKFGDFSAKVNANNGKYGYGSLISTDDRDKSCEYLVRVINLSKWIQDNNISNIAHIHLDIEGAEMDVLEQFNSPLHLTTHQLSLELQPNPNETLLDSFSRLSTIMKYHKFIPLIIDELKVLPFKDYKDFLINSTSCNIYCFSIKQYTAITSVDLVNEYQGFKF